MPPRSVTLKTHAEQLAKQYGARVAAEPEGPPVIISTGSLTVDRALREGGWRQNRIHEILGPPDVGKSTLMHYSAIQQQLADAARAVAYIDMEGTFDYDWAHGLGLDTSPGRWMHLYPNDSEDASDMARECCRSGVYSSVIVDSVGGMESRKALDKEAEKDQVGKNAQVITRMVKHLATLARQNRVTVLLVNQPRAVISSMGLPDQSAGPKAMQHATTTKLVMSKGGQVPRKLKFGDEEETVSVQVKAKVTRSKLVAPGRVAEFWINNRHTEEFGAPGIYRLEEYADLGIALGVIVQKNAWYQFPTGTQVQGRENVQKAMAADEALVKAVREGVLTA